MMSFAERLDLALIKCDVTAAELSRKLGLNESAISNYRAGRYSPKQERIEQIADALGISVAWLLGADVPMEAKNQPSALTEGEKQLLELFRSIPEDKQRFALDMLRAALQAPK